MKKSKKIIEEDSRVEYMKEIEKTKHLKKLNE